MQDKPATPTDLHLFPPPHMQHLHHLGYVTRNRNHLQSLFQKESDVAQLDATRWLTAWSDRQQRRVSVPRLAARLQLCPRLCGEALVKTDSWTVCVWELRRWQGYESLKKSCNDPTKGCPPFLTPNVFVYFHIHIPYPQTLESNMQYFWKVLA